MIRRSYLLLLSCDKNFSKTSNKWCGPKELMSYIYIYIYIYGEHFTNHIWRAYKIRSP